MTAYNVHLAMTVTAVVTVIADTPEQAIDLASESDKHPGSMVYGAFGDADVDESSDWFPVEVTETKSGKTVWTEPI